jgi:hypothetical protein
MPLVFRACQLQSRGLDCDNVQIIWHSHLILMFASQRTLNVAIK